MNTSTAGNPAPQVSDLGLGDLLAAAQAADRLERRGARDKLVAAYQWAIAHPATEHSGWARWADATPALSISPEGVETPESLGGEGTPACSPFAPDELGAALGIATGTAIALIADALDLVHRLPRLWNRVLDLSVPAWKARKIATDTRSLPADGAVWIDEQLVDRVASCGWGSIDRVVALARARYAPDDQASAEDRERARWDVVLHHPGPGAFAGSSELHAVGDTLDLVKLHDLVVAEAARLKALGDPDPVGARKAKALGLIADAHAYADLLGLLGTEPQTVAGDASPSTVRSAGLGAGAAAKTKLYLHLSLSDLAEPPGGEVAGRPIGEVERLGPATGDLIRRWVGHSRVIIQPVLDAHRDDRVDAHDPPTWMREVVILRDRQCVFPWCERDARACDLDHITPYDPTGPPGQTRPDNLAPLCRRHHRAKTTGRWRYTRTRHGHYHWHGPGRRSWLVTATRTIAIPPN